MTLERISNLRELARKCRRLARGIGDEAARRNLLALADEYEERANQLERGLALDPD
jgi:hypothetical protein